MTSHPQTTSIAPPPALPAFLTTREAARRLGISLRTAQLWVEGGILEAWKTSGGHRRITLASIERLQAGHVPAALPVPVAADAPSTPPTRRPVSLPRVLVVEDDPVLLKLYKMTIERWNLPLIVDCVSNGYEALLAIGRNAPDLLVSDLRMPGMDGFQMMRALTGSPFRDGMEIIVVSSLTDEEIVREGGLPADIRVFHKPVSFERLREITEARLARRAALIAATNAAP